MPPPTLVPLCRAAPPQDLSAAFFATGNVAIARSMLQEAAHLLKPLEPPPSTPGVPLATPPSTQSANLHAAAQPMNPSPPGDVDHRAGAEAGAGAEAVAEASSPTERSAPADGTLAPGHGPGSTRDGNGGVRSEGVPAWVGPGPFDPEFRTYGWEDLELGGTQRECPCFSEGVLDGTFAIVPAHVLVRTLVF